MKKKIKHVGNALRGVPVPAFPRRFGLTQTRNAAEGVPYNISALFAAHMKGHANA